MMSKKALVLVNTVTLIIMLIANYGFSTGVFSGTTVSAVSSTYNTLFTPAGYAFSIWSLIFLLTIGFVIYQWYLIKNRDAKNYIGRTGVWFTISNIANTLWLFCWTSDRMLLSVVLISILLVSLCILTLRLSLELDDEPVQTIFFVWWPIAFYLGWLMVATIANIAVYFVSIDWRGQFGEDIWVIIMIIIATILYIFLVVTKNLRESALVGIWAFIAIAIRQKEAYSNITTTAIAASAVLFIVISLHAYKNRNYNLFKKISKGEWK
jgi:hypothetical protein